MPSERLYYDDAYTTRFTARVAGRGAFGGRPAVELESTFFYPESGGQEADRGTLGGLSVVDVQADPEERVWHVLEGDAPADQQLEAQVDWARRFDHMQQHTGQHILSAAFEREAGAPTLSSRLGTERCTIEVGMAEADWKRVASLEEAANRIVWEDRPVERHWADERSVARFRLRKAPVVTGRIRIVEIPDWDVSACGGTHTRRTGEVGLIKIVRWEKVRGNLRFEFHCGARAHRDYAWRTEELQEAARRRTLGERELIAHLERAAAERDALRRQLDDLGRRVIAAEARERVGRPPRGVADLAEARPREELRRFALQCLEAGAPWVVAAARAPEPALVLGRAREGGADLRALLPELLERARGKGGGSPDLLHVRSADPAGVEAAFTWASDAVPAAVEGAR